MKKNYTLTLRVSKEEKEKIEAKAELAGMSVSALLRFLSLKTILRPNVITKE